MDRISEKVIWLTGASSGIGEALAYTLNGRGCRLILSSRAEKALVDVKSKCKYPGNVVVFPLDLEDTAAMPAKVQKAISCFGQIDILINNAGLSQRSLILYTSLEVYRRLMDINYLGTVALTTALLPHFISRKKGHIVTVTSLMGKFGSPFRSGYCAAKHALHGFFDVLRMEHEKDGLDVSLICPGFVATNIAKNALQGDGSSKGTDDRLTAGGMSADDFAQKMIRAIERKKHEAFIGGKEVSGAYLKRFFPKLLHRVVLRSQVV